MKKIYTLVIVLLSFFTFSCSSSQNTSSKSLKPKILVSIPPYTYFVKKIALDTVDTVCLVPEGSNPHLFEPTPRQVQEVYESKVWISIGESFEKKITTTLKKNHKTLTIVDLSKLIPADTTVKGCSCGHHHEHEHHESQDLHIWMSPRLAKQQAIAIEEALTSTFPEQAEFFNKNLSDFIAELDQIDDEISLLLSPFKDQAVLVSHPAFGYFCKDYGLEQISIEIEGKDPRPKDISQILEKAKNTNVRVVIVQEQHNNKGALAIANELNIPVFNTDPYSSEYKQTLLNISQQIAKAHD
ncbi:MAG: hypothetical protein FJZ57_04145 [Chlamydiae bacterium]|nr:hypothetical protein [Chlamydiota bacterium]